MHSHYPHCCLTWRSTGPIAAGRHLGYKSLAQIPARRNRPVSLYVRPHRIHRCPFKFRLKCKTESLTNSQANCQKWIALQKRVKPRSTNWPAMRRQAESGTEGLYAQPPTIINTLQFQLSWLLQKSHSSSWLALCAGVLRRAVSHPARPSFRNATSSVSAGRS